MSDTATAMFSLEGKVIVVTGAASGIGAATVRRLNAAGATPVLLDREDASALADELGGSFIKTDVSTEDQVATATEKIAEEHGRIDVMINNAGISLDPVPIADTTEEHYREHFDINTMGVLWGIKHAAPYMKPGSAIINTASVCGVMGFPSYASYNTSKYGVVALTQVAAMELGPKAIRVNCVCPTSVESPMLWDFPIGKAEAKVLGTMSALGRIIEPDHVAALMHFLAADDCPVISGQPVLIDCGLSAGISRHLWDALADEAADD